MQQLAWRLRVVCAQRAIWSAAELRRLVHRRTGVRLNPQTAQSWFKNRPARLDVLTLTAIVNALACSVEELIHFTAPATDREALATPRELSRYQGRSQTERAPVPRTTMPSAGEAHIGRIASPRTEQPQADAGCAAPAIKNMLKVLAEAAEPMVALPPPHEVTLPSTASTRQQKEATTL